MTADQIKAVLDQLNDKGALTLIGWLKGGLDRGPDAKFRPVLADFTAWVAQRPQYLRPENPAK